MAHPAIKRERTDGRLVCQHTSHLSEIAIFLSLGLGYYFGSFTYKGLGLGAVTATLIAAVLIGQLGITISPPLKPTFFLMFLFAIGYEVGPQFVRGIAKDGIPQALFAVVVCFFCLGAAYFGACLPDTISVRQSVSMPVRRRYRLRWGSRPTPSIAWSCRRNRARPCWMRCRLPTP